MPTLLHIGASPRKTRSVSLEVAHMFTDAYRRARPGDRIETIDLWDIALPEFNGDAMDAKYAGLSGTSLTQSQQQAWDRIRELAKRLHDADTLLFSIPLWNFSIPYKLKHFIDVVSQKDILFSFDPGAGFGGLLQNKRAVVIYARGLDYSQQSFTPAALFDYQQRYMDAWLRFIGVEQIESVVVDRTLFDRQADPGAWQAIRDRTTSLASASPDSASPR
jgi:FMN-dependent NADH-azoreductase